MTVVSEEYSVQAHESDTLMHEYLSSGRLPPANLIEQSRFYLSKRIKNYQQTGDIRPLLTYHGLEWRECSKCHGIEVNTDDLTVKFIAREELTILYQEGVPIKGLHTTICI